MKNNKYFCLVLFFIFSSIFISFGQKVEKNMSFEINIKEIFPDKFVSKINLITNDTSVFLIMENIRKIVITDFQGQIIGNMDTPSEFIHSFGIDIEGRLMLLDGEEKIIYLLNFNKWDSIPYHSPNEWYANINNLYKKFFVDFIFIPTYFIDISKTELRSEFGTRFNHEYILFMDNENRIYSCSYGIIYLLSGNDGILINKPIVDKNLFFSQNINLNTKVYTLFNDFNTLLYNTGCQVLLENLKTHIIEVIDDDNICFANQYFYRENILYGIHRIDKDRFKLNTWKFK